MLNISSTYEVDSSSDYRTIIKGEPLFDLLPLKYKVEVINISDISVVWITGTRCKWECDRETRSCQEPSCWTNPSLCLGEIDTCTKLDGDGSCVKASDVEDYEDGNTFSFTSIDLEKYIYQQVEINLDFTEITSFGSVDFGPPKFISWMCNSTVVQEDHHVICYSTVTSGLSGPSYALLKTIAG